MGESGRVGARPWIVPGAGSQFAEAHGLIDLFSRQNGFYRPVVSLTFALNQRLFGLEPFGYGYPWTAPSYYTFTFAPGLVLGNLADDMDRTSTLALLHAIGGTCDRREEERCFSPPPSSRSRSSRSTGHGT